ncbi:three component ABC system middle component [Methanolapillus millepedarum]|uniref:Uncharacterized protein n=1 Tax=Methanolapillus millepedarum TaxID=3028296 RepID=A0AA96ZVH9_9EURY|nr:hypothetical protein MsAc7_10130 [Methanosarcinaceae archaeon Ac7]
MIDWSKRNEEEANLFNPPFLSILCYESIKNYNEETKLNSPFILPFLIIPFILHKKTRDRLPSTTRTQFTTWMVNETNSSLKIDYNSRANAFVPYVKEAIIYSCNTNLIQFSREGNFEIRTKLSKDIYSNEIFTEDALECIKKASFCGKWFARSGDINTIMLFLGVRP